MTGQIENQAEKRPLVTFALFAYNQENYIREAIDGALSQTYEPLEIILSDDCSTDRTYEIMRRMAESYAGPHSIVLNRNEKNLHIGGHVEKIFTLARSEWTVFAAGDDISLPNRVADVAKVFSEIPNCRAVFSDYTEISMSGQVVGEQRTWNYLRQPRLVDICASGGGVGPGATYAYHRDVATWPHAYPTHLFNEDRILPLRAALLGMVVHVPHSLVSYRLSDTGLSRSLCDHEISVESKPDHTQEMNITLDCAVAQNRLGRSHAARLRHARNISVKIFKTRHCKLNTTGVRHGFFYLYMALLFRYRALLCKFG